MLFPGLMMRCLINLASNAWTSSITAVNQELPVSCPVVAEFNLTGTEIFHVWRGFCLFSSHAHVTVRDHFGAGQC